MNTTSQIITGCIVAIILLCQFVDSAHAASDGLAPVNLRCEYLVDPLGLGETAPRLSWMLNSSQRGDSQIAYQVLVASSLQILAKEQGDLWDTGKVESDESAHVVYAGRPLVSRMNCYWKVRVWSSSGNELRQWSTPARWTMGLLNAEDWQAKWIDTSKAQSDEAAKNPITILHATYEAVPAKVKPATAATRIAATTQSSQPMDVTSTLSGLVTNGSLNVLINNRTMGGDPAANEYKRVVVEYQQSGKIFTTAVAENLTLSLPPLSKQLWYLRKTFTAKSPVQSAILYATALGVYEVHLNGGHVGDQVLAPGWTDYNKRIRYQAYDVTSMITTGNNTIAAEVADGWYAGHLGNGGYQQYGNSPALLAQLQVTYTDGSIEQVVTDSTWQIHKSPVLASDFMLGETHDARLEQADWDQPASISTDWLSASIREAKVGVLESQVAPAIRETGQIKPISMAEPAPGKWTFDLGQNMVGVIRLKVSAPAGTVITIRHAEMLKADGEIYTANLRAAPSVDVYTCRGGRQENWQPQFTFHGFRYVEVTGLASRPTMDLITGIVLGSDTPRTGSFSCSDARVNQLMSNIQWGQRGNYLSVPTDCPQRDERLGWMGDAEVFVRTATCNADVAAFFTKWLVDVDDAQTTEGAFTSVSPDRGAGYGAPAWGDAGVICPWTIYLAYNDKRILEKHLPAMTKWVEWCRQNSTGLIRDQKQSRGGDYGDWLSIQANTPKDLIGTAYFAYSTHLVAQSYAATGNKEQAAKYQHLFEDIRDAFDKKYVAQDGRIQGNTQCCYAMALKFELLPESLRANAAQYLVDDIKARDWHLSTGFVGVSYLLPMLTATNHIDTAYRLLLQDTFPSWLFSVKQGATTIWERWDGWTPEKGFQDPGMNSFNHYSLGSCGEWLYDSVAGIKWDLENPGYKHVIIQPRVLASGGLTAAKGTIGSPYGKISSAWRLVDEVLTLDITLPPNTTATVYVPVHRGDTVTESGNPAEHAEGVRFVRSEAQANIYELQSGSFAFSVRLTR